MQQVHNHAMATIEQDGNGAFGHQKSEEKLQRDAVYSACDTVFFWGPELAGWM